MAKLFGVVVLAALFASRADAAPLVVSAGDFLTFNFDLSGETPKPPYVLAGFIPNTSGLDFEPLPCGDFCALLDVGEWKLWTELDGKGELFFFWDLSLGGAFQLEMLDGVFSATLQVFEGSITVDPVACGVAADGSRTSGCPPFEPPVPEPATLGLLALGGALVARRRLAWLRRAA